MCNCMDQNTNKNMKFQIYSFASQNFKFEILKFVESKKFHI